VQWNDEVGIHILKRRNRVPRIIRLVRREVEAADDGMHFVNAE
jgi:hypothetical protein